MADSHQFPVDREAANLLRTCCNKPVTSCQQVCCVVVMEFATQQTQRTFVTFALSTAPAMPRPARAS